MNITDDQPTVFSNFDFIKNFGDLRAVAFAATDVGQWIQAHVVFSSVSANDLLDPNESARLKLFVFAVETDNFMHSLED